MLSVGMITAPREVQYIAQTIASLLPQIVAEGLDIFAEPESPIPDWPRLTVHRSPIKLGNFHNWIRAAEYLLTKNTSHILIVEDDVVFSKTAIKTAKQLLEQLPEDMGYLSLYMSGKYASQAKLLRGNLNVVYFNVQRLWGACAMVFPRKSLEQILDSNTFKTWNGTREDRSTLGVMDGIDIAIQNAIKELKIKHYFFCQPSLVQHIGECSSVGNTQGLTRQRTAAYFED